MNRILNLHYTELLLYVLLVTGHKSDEKILFR